MQRTCSGSEKVNHTDGEENPKWVPVFVELAHVVMCIYYFEPKCFISDCADKYIGFTDSQGYSLEHLKRFCSF